MIMRWMMAAVVLLLVSGTALAMEGARSVEAALSFGTEAFDGLGGEWGATLAGGAKLRSDLQARAELSYYRASTAKGDVDLTATRVPIDLDLRYLVPLERIDPELSAFGEGGIEVSFDHWHPAPDASRSETRFGGIVGAGLHYALPQNYSAFIRLDYRVIEDSYLTAGIGLGYSF
ncbi:hypothetical protein GMSM_43280 [Geomonas sp. Red276]